MSTCNGFVIRSNYLLPIICLHCINCFVNSVVKSSHADFTQRTLHEHLLIAKPCWYYASSDVFCPLLRLLDLSLGPHSHLVLTRVPGDRIKSGQPRLIDVHTRHYDASPAAACDRNSYIVCTGERLSRMFITSVIYFQAEMISHVPVWTFLIAWSAHEISKWMRDETTNEARKCSGFHISCYSIAFIS